MTVTAIGRVALARPEALRPVRRPKVGGRAARRAGLALAAVLVALGAALAPAGAPVARAAADGLDLATVTTYTVAPAARVVHVTIDLTARNLKPNVTSGGILTRYFYDGARLAIHLEARNVAARSGGTHLKATTNAADGYAILDVRFASSLFYKQATKVRVTYDLPSGAPRSASDIRVGAAFATFTAWAFGDRGSVRVQIPATFEAETTGATVTKGTSGTTTVFRASAITDVAAWYLVVTADRKAGLTKDRIDLSGGEHLIVHAWPEDKEWSSRVRDLLTRGLPVLVASTGLDWPVTGDIEIFEVHTPLLEGYSGVFFAAQDKIEISEDLDDLTILHEASHAWFNRRLFDGRWINEGLADTFAANALRTIAAGEFTPDPVTPTSAGNVKLEAWVHPGRIGDDDTEARERFGYEASWTVISSIVREVGDDAFRKVLAAAEHHTIAYAGSQPAETVTTANDWKRLLDLLDQVGGSTTADELFRRWVLTDEDARLLDVRATVRAAYASLVTAGGGDWPVPFYVREPMAAWQFDSATKRMNEAKALLDRRDEIASVASSLGVPAPSRLATAYSEARESFDVATRTADQEMAALQALKTATAAVAAPRAPYVAVGLIGESPETALAAAREAVAAEAPDAAAKATAVTTLIDGSVEIGRGRMTAAAIVALIGIVVLMIAIALLVRRRRARRLSAIGPAVEMAATRESATAAIEGPGAVFEPAVGDAAHDPAVAAEPGPAVTAPEPEAATGLAAEVLEPAPAAADEAPYATLADPPPDAAAERDNGDAS